MGSTRAKRIHRFTVPRQWAHLIDEGDETAEYRRIGNVSRFDPPREEAPRWEDLDGDWDGDLDEAREW